VKDSLKERSANSCELCQNTDGLTEYIVPPKSGNSDNEIIILCSKCLEQIQGNEDLDSNHWHCLQDSAWSEVESVQVMAYRLLKKLQSEGWAQTLLESLYLDEEVLAWAEDDDSSTEVQVKTVDSNGTLLTDGDSVTIIKDLDVKGTSFVAKRGTIVKNISLTSNPEHIEGRVNKTKLVLKTCFLKKV
jgi:protein PhnA